jgi:hypothetical protein
MSKIVQTAIVLAAFLAFSVTVAAGFLSGVQPVTVLIRGAIALGIFGTIGAFFFRVVAKNIAVDIQRNQIEEMKQTNQNAAEMQAGSAETPQL